MNYLQTIKAVKNFNEDGISRKTAFQVCRLVKELADCMYDWDMNSKTFVQWSVISDLVENIEQMYR